MGGEGGGPYQYQANLVSRPNIAFARLDPGNFVLHLYEKALTVWSDVYIVQCFFIGFYDIHKVLESAKRKEIPLVANSEAA